jgi:MYXO-CTERM domain-containing protein
MNRATSGLLCFVALASGTFLAPERALAGIGACGNIHVEAEAQCEVVSPGVACEGMCTDLSVQAACSAQLAVDCRAECDQLPSAQCSGRCEAGCQAECTDLEPGRFDCGAACQADCSGQCEARCKADEDGAGCMARCEGSCSASCDASCEIELPEADCDAACEASCEGSCEVDANLDCQANCQGRGEARCEASIRGNCELDCRGEKGALFCDSRYVDHGGNLERCIDALNAAIDVEVEAHSEGNASCAGGRCMAEGSANASIRSNCSTAPVGSAGQGLAGFGLAVIAFALGRRRSARGPRTRD